MGVAPRGRHVVVVGAGYAGVTVAAALDEHAEVTLVEPKDAFQHNVAALRAVVDPAWPERIFLPYHHLLRNGTLRRDRAVGVTPGRVDLASGAQIDADVIVLATGSTYPFPAKTDLPAAQDSIARYHRTQANLARADRVLLLGAGAVGLELAGEIAAHWPDKQITMVDLADRILPGPFDERLRDELNRQLDLLGVRRVLGSPLAGPPVAGPGEVTQINVTTVDGREIDADIWFTCHGVAPVTDYLTGALAATRASDGSLSVTSEFELVGCPTVYAIGDIAAGDLKKASVAARQADVAAANIRAYLDGRDDRVDYTPAPPSIILPLGPTGGAGQRGDTGEIMPAAMVAEFKGRDLMVDRFAKLLNVPVDVG
jgi:apoptosis-inducing factor 2